MSNWLLQYRDAIRSGEILAGMDMIRELESLIADLDDPQYHYDTKDAEIRISFIEECMRNDFAEQADAEQCCELLRERIQGASDQLQ